MTYFKFYKQSLTFCIFTATKKIAFSNRIVDDWNSISDNCVSSTTLHNFKSHIRLQWTHSGGPCMCIFCFHFKLLQKFRFQYQFEGKGLWNNSGSSVKQSDLKIQNGRRNPRWLPISSFFRIMPHNFCTIEPRMVIFVSIPRFACMSN